MIEIKKVKVFPQCAALIAVDSISDDCRNCIHWEKCSKVKDDVTSDAVAPGNDPTYQRGIERMLWMETYVVYGINPKPISSQLLDKLMRLYSRKHENNSDNTHQDQGLRRFGGGVPDFDGDVFVKRDLDKHSSGILASEFDGDDVCIPGAGGISNTSKPPCLKDFEGDTFSKIPLGLPKLDAESKAYMARCYHALMFEGDDDCKKLMKFPEKGYTIHKADLALRKFEDASAAYRRDSGVVLNDYIMDKILDRYYNLIKSSIM